MSAVNGHRRRSSAAMNNSLAGAKDVSPEELEKLAAGVQVIDEQKMFTSSLPLYLSSQNLLTAGFSYHVVAVFGSQSTGKSTLLNHLFGTDFNVMDAKTARQQTTKGIWMSRAKEDESMNMGKNILVMDVEGTDGRERGEDQDFERKSALFALATSEVLIVNIWEHQVGLYQGANMGLLKTVFEVNLGLFLKDRSTTHRSLLFFVIRDHIGDTPLVNLSNTLIADLTRIWTSLAKPPGLENSEITDFFDFEFTALPHKMLQAEKFIDETKKLRGRFREGIPAENDSLQDQFPVGNKDGIFLPAYHRRIPADGFPMYAENIWNQIVTNKDLDLPSQQELLAQFRCDEIAATCTAGFNDIIAPFEEQAKAGKVMAGLGPAMKQALGTAVEGFEEAGGRYHKAVFERKRDELRKALETRLRSLVVGQFTALSKRAVAEFTEDVTNVLKLAANSASSTYDFAKIVLESREKVVSKFKEEAEECYIPGEATSWSSYDTELEGLQKDIDEIAARLRGEEMKRLVARLERDIKTKLQEPVELEFKRMDETLWDRVWKTWQDTLSDAVGKFETKSRSFNSTDEETAVGTWRLRRRGWAVLRARIDEEVLEGNLLLKLRESFEDKFRYDEHNVPRVWKPTDDIEGAYAKALNATLVLIPRVSQFTLSATSSPPDVVAYLGEAPAADNFDEEPVDSTSFEILSEAKQHDLTQRFKRMADSVFIEAKRSAIGGVAQIPTWMYGLLLALGWNEIWAVVTSPFYFMFLIMLGLVGYVIYSLNLWGPIYKVGNAAVEQGVEVGKERLREFLMQQNGGRVPAAFAGRLERDTDNIAMDNLDSKGEKKSHDE
ncbi:RHD3/Sey1 [Pyronema domesticum]|uniref:Similar to Protein sey1 acc. no. A6S544 n=1 Tax=Pyronema omphalodes (strain CBS 100304) TaxID=1076935 RepID=U4KWB9_PYROM|nr:RHD3/Sey1 [Pyronema domesticum]CCX05391.1 Similar to Protein sey1; acc. no. A6S544 [Pyronema omphalodes CBS 100304]